MVFYGDKILFLLLSHLYIFPTSKFYTCVYFHNGSYHPFISDCRVSFCKAGLVVMNFLSFCLSEKL